MGFGIFDGIAETSVWNARGKISGLINKSLDWRNFLYNIPESMKLLSYIVVMVFLFNNACFAEEVPALESADYQTFLKTEYIPFKSVFTELPATGWNSLKMAFSKESLPYWGLILGSSAVLYEYDQTIVSSVQETGRNWGIGNQDNTHAKFSVGPYDVRFPTDKGSTLYFLGDGITHITIAGSFIGYGAYTDSPRAYNTGLQLVHGLMISTVFNQLLKRSFGRETPAHATAKRGKWRPFPSFNEYNDDIPKYDAMPSGHIMTATMTFTVIITNYPEYEYWLRPLEVVWLSALGLEMVNNGVHWASDYPLGIAMGYLYGKAVTNLGRQSKKIPKPDEVTWMIYPSVDNDGTNLTNLVVNF